MSLGAAPIIRALQRRLLPCPLISSAKDDVLYLPVLHAKNVLFTKTPELPEQIRYRLGGNPSEPDARYAAFSIAEVRQASAVLIATLPISGLSRSCVYISYLPSATC